VSATPPAAVIDPQSAGTADTVTKARRDWKRPRKVNRRKRLVAVDVACLLLAAIGRARVRQRLLRGGGVTLVPVRWRHIPPPQDARQSLGAGAANSACWTG
jgi:hypothetical protein